GTTAPNALRVSGSAGTTMYLANTDDGTLLCFTGHNTTTTSGNINTVTARGVGTLNSSYAFNLATTYTGTSGNQTRCATRIDNTTWYIGDQGGIYTNGTSTASPATNILSVKSFGAVVYACQAATIGTLSAASGGTITALPGLGAITAKDFYLIS